MLYILVSVVTPLQCNNSYYMSVVMFSDSDTVVNCAHYVAAYSNNNTVYLYSKG